ncbi:hypothetical protein DV701_04250 [Ornithinimicrobium avium]|uniref:Uncharacterized protein n=2 Tax=Ornithinimicrobium avium TaxID=2283195 RepID=A0A345NK85_9MICO|nr:hypothetical protein DV701_04250 [Ornithinimicrobium avium]
MSALTPFLAEDAAVTTAPVPGGSGAAVAATTPLIGLAWASLGLSALAVGVALIFMYAYHQRLIKVVEMWVRRGGQITATDDHVRDEGLAGAQAAGFGIISDAENDSVEPGQVVAFQATGVDDEKTNKVIWITAEGFPREETGPTFSSRAPTTGTFTVTATADGEKPATITLTVKEKSGAQDAPGPTVALPFAIRGWGGLVITILGLGIVAALMFAKVVSAEGGLAILGTLLGVGAGSALTSGKSDAEPASTSAGQSDESPTGS